MSRPFFNYLAQVHRHDDLEALLDSVAAVIREHTDWATVLLTFYFGEDVFYGAAGCPEGIKERFREGFERTSTEDRRRKRAEILKFKQPGTNLCFIPAGEGPRTGIAYVRGQESDGSWHADDRMMIALYDWQDNVRGVLSLDNPRSGSRPGDAAWEELRDIDRFANVVTKIAENRFWSLRLAESEAAYRGIFDAATDAMFISDETGALIEVNGAACRMHGYDYEEMIGRRAMELIHPDDWATYADSLEGIAQGREVRAEGTSVRKDGTTFDAEVRAVAFQYRGRRCMLAILQDVTERKRVYRRLLEQQKDESIVAVAGGVAHDFNNLLMGITGSVGLLRRYISRGSAAEAHVDRVEVSAEKLTRLTGQLLAVARGIHSEPRPLSLRSVIEENLALVRGMVEASFHLDLDLADDLWTVYADRVQLGQVVLNLSQNACEAMTHGGRLGISASNVTRDAAWTCNRTGTHPAGDYVRLCVKDDGHGVDAETMCRLFEPYFSTKPSGSGLGLAAVLGIVRRHHGAIRLDSTPGKGTAIEVLLPRTPEPVEEPPVEERPARETSQKRCVLLVDDDDVVREVAKAMLETLGCQVLEAEGGERALEIYTENGATVDVVLLDVSMPGMSGVETHAALRAIDPDVCVLMSSGHTERLVRDDIAGATPIAGFIQKPYDLKALREALEQACP